MHPWYPYWNWLARSPFYGDPDKYSWRGIGNPDAYVGQAVAPSSGHCPYGFTWTYTRQGWRCAPISPTFPEAAAQTSWALPPARYKLVFTDAQGHQLRNQVAPEPVTLGELCARLRAAAVSHAESYVSVHVLEHLGGRWHWVPTVVETVAHALVHFGCYHRAAEPLRPGMQYGVTVGQPRAALDVYVGLDIPLGDLQTLRSAAESSYKQAYATYTYSMQHKTGFSWALAANQIAANAANALRTKAATLIQGVYAEINYWGNVWNQNLGFQSDTVDPAWIDVLTTDYLNPALAYKGELASQRSKLAAAAVPMPMPLSPSPYLRQRR